MVSWQSRLRALWRANVTDRPPISQCKRGQVATIIGEKNVMSLVGKLLFSVTTCCTVNNGLGGQHRSLPSIAVCAVACLHGPAVTWADHSLIQQECLSTATFFFAKQHCELWKRARWRVESLFKTEGLCQEVNQRVEIGHSTTTCFGTGLCSPSPSGWQGGRDTDREM